MGATLYNHDGKNCVNSGPGKVTCWSNRSTHDRSSREFTVTVWAQLIGILVAAPQQGRGGCSVFLWFSLVSWGLLRRADSLSNLNLNPLRFTKPSLLLCRTETKPGFSRTLHFSTNPNRPYVSSRVLHMECPRTVCGIIRCLLAGLFTSTWLGQRQMDMQCRIQWKRNQPAHLIHVVLVADCVAFVIDAKRCQVARDTAMTEHLSMWERKSVLDVSSQPGVAQSPVVKSINIPRKTVYNAISGRKVVDFLLSVVLREDPSSKSLKNPKCCLSHIWYREVLITQRFICMKFVNLVIITTFRKLCDLRVLVGQTEFAFS